MHFDSTEMVTNTRSCRTEEEKKDGNKKRKCTKVGR